MDIDGTLYGVTNAGEAGESELITINPSNGIATELCNFGNVTDVEGVTIANDGTMYISTGASSSTPNRIYRVDNRNTCQVTLLSNINFGSHIDIEDIACPVFPTTAVMEEATATRYGDRVLLEWRTGYEVDTLGFLIYREENAARHRLNESLIAGSVLLTGPRIGLTAGQKYSWWDEPPRGAGPPRYWIEEIDISGQRFLYGPIVPTVGLGPPRKVAASPVLNRLGRSWASAATTLDLSGNRGRTSSVLGFANRATSLVEGSGTLSGDVATQWRLAAGPAIKIEVAQPGWYRLTQPELLAAGLDPQTDPRRLQLYVEGREVAMRVLGEEDGRFDPTDAIEFYGVGQDTPWTDRRVYWLVIGDRPGRRLTVSSASGGLPLIAGGFPYTIEKKDRTVYFANLKNGDADNFFGPVIEVEPVVARLRVDHMSEALPNQALLEVSLQGVTEVEHRVQIAVNGTPVGEAVFSGQQATTVTPPLRPSHLRVGDNEVTLTRQGGETDISLLDVIRLTYTRAYVADGDQLWMTAPAGRRLLIGGFTRPEIAVVDVTDPDAPQILPGTVQSTEQGYGVTIGVPWANGLPRRLYAFTNGKVLRPVMVTGNEPSDWHDPRHGADIVIISHRTFLPSLAPLVALRRSQGYTVAVVDVEDVFDEFRFGAKSPWAMREFLLTARSRWATKPRFVLLVGDASFDPRNYLGLGDFDFVPTKLVATIFLETASDDWFVDFDGDDVADIPIGRLPVRTAAEADTVVAKLVAYERNLSDADWTRRVLLVADANEGYDFETASELLRSMLPEGIVVETIYRGRSPTAREKLLQEIAHGAWLINYMGHGSVELWRGGLLTSADAEMLTNAPRFPLVVAMTCLNGMFHDLYTESLAEALLKSARGGAIAVWASSGLTFPDDQARLNRALIGALFDQNLATVGEAVLRAKAGSEVQDLRRSWILLGDPATRLR